MIDRRTFDLNTACGEVSLEVCAVILCIPEAPLSDRENREALSFCAFVCKYYLLNFTVVVLGNEECNFSLKAVLLTLDDGVAHTVAALIFVKFGLNRRPAGIPDRAVVVDVEITAAHIQRYVVVTVTCDSSESRVHVEAVAACSVGDQ